MPSYFMNGLGYQKDQTVITGDLNISGNITLTGGGNIQSTVNGDISLLPNGTGITKVGTGTPTYVTAGLFVADKFEVDGKGYFDNGIFLKSNFDIQTSTSTGAIATQNAQQNVSCVGLYTGSSSNYILFCEYDDRSYDFNHALQTNPTFYIHSASQSATEWISISHDQTNGRITAGAGAVQIGSTTCALRLPSMNSTQISALTPGNGDMVYNTTTNKGQIYENGAWANLI